MLIAARNGFMAGGKLSAKSYIQDGLIAMWDGIENAGWGVHDSSALPVNLCGNSVVPLTWYGGGDIEDKAFVLNSNTYGEGTTIDFSNWNGITLEYVVDYRDFGLSVSSGSFGWGGGPNYRVRPAMLSGDEHFLTGRQATCWSIFNFIAPISVHGSSVVVFDFDYSTTKLYNNGMLYGAMAIPSIGTKVSTGTFIINKWYTFASVKRLALNCGRVYSRALTADEIAANYAVDKARFNLP